MELSRKTTILFSPDLHDQLTHLARQLDTSLGELVRQACQAHYNLFSLDERLAAVRELEAMSLPIGEPEDMARESVPDAT
jgi:predicted transcriptional regulator